jgi:hypothetical protein
MDGDIAVRHIDAGDAFYKRFIAEQDGDIHIGYLNMLGYAYQRKGFAQKSFDAMLARLQHFAVYAVFKQKAALVFGYDNFHFATLSYKIFAGDFFVSPQPRLLDVASAENARVRFAGQMLSCAQPYPVWIPRRKGCGIGFKQAVSHSSLANRTLQRKWMPGFFCWAFSVSAIL